MKTEWGIVYRYRGGNYRFTLYVYNDQSRQKMRLYKNGLMITRRTDYE